MEVAPAHRAGQPNEFARVLLLLAFDDGSYLTGQTRADWANPGHGRRADGELGRRLALLPSPIYFDPSGQRAANKRVGSANPMYAGFTSTTACNKENDLWVSSRG